jgi:hypothetical protein
MIDVDIISIPRQRDGRRQRDLVVADGIWASDARARVVAGHPVYSLRILSEVTWKKTEPTAHIEMTIVDDGRLRLTALRSSFVTCAL